MSQRVFMQWMLIFMLVCCATVFGAESPAAIRDREVAVAHILRSEIFPAEIQFQAGGYQDLNQDKIGEFGWIAQIAGLGATTSFPHPDGTRYLHLLEGPFATGRTAGGYVFAAVLPGGPTGLLCEQDAAPEVGLPGVLDRQRFFAVLAWPAEPELGTQDFLLTQDGTIYTAAHAGRPPDAAQAIRYDPAARTWTTPWRAADPRSKLADAKRLIQNEDPAGALAQIEWVWCYCAAAGGMMPYEVNAKDFRDQFVALAESFKPARAAYEACMTGAYNQALAGAATLPSPIKGQVVPAETADFARYLLLAERAQTPEQLVAAFKHLDAVSHAAAQWQYAAMAIHLIQQDEFAYMGTFSQAFDGALRQSYSDDLLEAYRIARMDTTGARADYAKALLEDAIQRLALLRLVYGHTQRRADLEHLDAFARAVLKPDEVRALEQATQGIESRARTDGF